MGDTTIEWTDATWNPVTGCTKVSAGCKNCYAERVFPRAYSRECLCGHRIRIHDHTMESNPCLAPKCFCGEFRPRQFTDVRCHPERLEQPLHWREPKRVFVNSMSDMFHEAIDEEFTTKMVSIMAAASWHQFQILTKRPLQMLRYIESHKRKLSFMCEQWPIPNIWLGVSIENRATLDRLDVLRQTPAAVRFVSFEPLLEDLGVIDLSGIHWAIIGGESGPCARPCNIQWIRDAKCQCQAANVPVFVKQLGANVTSDDAHWPQAWIAGKRAALYHRKGGNPAEWPEDLRVREYPR